MGSSSDEAPDTQVLLQMVALFKRLPMHRSYYDKTEYLTIQHRMSSLMSCESEVASSNTLFLHDLHGYPQSFTASAEPSGVSNSIPTFSTTLS